MMLTGDLLLIKAGTLTWPNTRSDQTQKITDETVTVFLTSVVDTYKFDFVIGPTFVGVLLSRRRERVL